MNPRRLAVASVAGIIGPIGFVSAWLFGSITTDGYSAVEDAISRLAASGASTRAVMNIGFVCFGVCVPLFALTLRSVLGGHAWKAACVTGIATLGVAALPLDVSAGIDRAHGVAAGIGYASLAVTPFLASGALARRGYTRAATISRVASVLSSASLIATLAGPAQGFFQRFGLTIGDAWIVVVAWAIASKRMQPSS